MRDRRVTLELPLPADTRIEWSIPEPRPGLAGVLDRMAGPGLQPAELGLFAAASLAAVTALVVAERSGVLGVSWSPGQLLVACFLALNVGFVCIIATGASKRWYHRHGPIRGRALTLVLVDGLFQLALANAVFAWGDPRYLLALGPLFVFGGLLIPRLPLHLCRPIALMLCFVGVLDSLYVAPMIAGLEWFPLIFFLKYFVAHLPREEPYRPAGVGD